MSLQICFNLCRSYFCFECDDGIPIVKGFYLYVTSFDIHDDFNKRTLIIPFVLERKILNLNFFVVICDSILCCYIIDEALTMYDFHNLGLT